MRVLAARKVGVVRADLTRGWAFTSRPPTLGQWVSGLHPDPLRVPAGSPLIRLVWIADDYVTGVLFAVVSVVLFVVAAVVRWLALHPLRRWSALLVCAATVVALIVL